MNALGTPILAVFSEPRERIYRALLAEPGRDWRVSQLAEQVPQVSVEACLACGELEPCRQRDTARAVLFGHNRQLPRRRPMELIGACGDFASADGLPFDAFGTLTGSQTQVVTA